MGKCTPWNIVLVLARSFTSTELARRYDSLVDESLQEAYLDALSLHARRRGWGELIEENMMQNIGGGS